MSWKVKRISRYSTLGTISDYVDDVNGFLIRVGFRDPATGEIYKDTKFTSFVSNLRPYFGKIKIGYYFDSQAINTDEAIEEAGYVLSNISAYQNDFPVFFNVDIGGANKTGRADNIDPTTRYLIYKAFSESVEKSGFIVDYTHQELIDIPAADALGATLIRKYSSYYPEIDGVEIDGWEYASNDQTLHGTTGVCPITVYNDIADWESSGDKPISDYLFSFEDTTDDSKYDYNETTSPDTVDFDGNDDLEVDLDFNILGPDTFCVYTGKQIKPKLYNPYGLIEGVDYSVFYKNNVNVNDPSSKYYQPMALVYGLNSYSGTTEINFNIIPADIATAPIVLTPSTATYTGKPIKPYVSINGLKSYTDFTVKYQDNVNVGTYSVTITGRKNYEGTVVAKFIITPLEIKADMFYIDHDSYPFTGGQVTPHVHVKDSVAGDEWADLDDGRFDYGDVRDPSYDPDDPDIIDYDGGDECDEEKVKFLGDYDFNESFLSNYTFEYGTNEDVGKDSGVIYLFGINNFVGEAEIYFDIIKDSFEGEFILDPTSFVYNELPHYPKVINIGGGLPDDNRFHYTEEYYEEALAAGDDGRFDYGEISRNEDYPISPDLVDFDGENEEVEVNFDFDELSPESGDDPTDDVVNVEGGEYYPESTYIDDGRFDYGEGEDPVVAEGLIDFDGNDDYLADYDMAEMIDDDNVYTDEYNFDELSTLKEGENYTVEYYDNVDVGKGKVRITGIFPFIAETTLEFDIVGIDINSPCYRFYLPYISVKFTGEPIEPEVLFEKYEGAIKEDPTFDIEYKNNTNYGTAYVTITGNGNFYGSITMAFQIVAGDLSTDCECRCGEPTEDGLYDFHKFEVYDVVRNKKLVYGEDYYFDNESYYFYYPYNPTYIRVYRKVTGYYNYTGTLECTYPTLLDGVVPAVPKIGGISVEILFMNGGKIPEKEQKDPEPEYVPPEYDPWVPDDEDPEPSGHGPKWIPIEDLFPGEKDIQEEADPTLINSFPPGYPIKLYNCKYYSSPENFFAEKDLLSGAFYIYNYHVVNGRVRITTDLDHVNKPGTITGWIETTELYFTLDGIDYRIGDYVLVLKDIYKNPDGTGGIVAKKGTYMYIVALATSLAWDFGDQDVQPFMTDISNTDYDFYILSAPMGTHDATNIDDNRFEYEDEESDVTVDFDGEDETEAEYDLVTLCGDEDLDTYDVPDNPAVYPSDTWMDVPDGEDTLYDFLKMAAEPTVKVAGYAIGLATRVNQVPIGWASTDMITIADGTEVDDTGTIIYKK